jgi:hypothetical protein
MKSLVLILVVIVSTTFSVAAQTPCPTVSVSGPSGITLMGENMTFTANVQGIDLSKITFKWTISGGEIISGQGTRIVTAKLLIDPRAEASLAVVEISGLPENCPNTAGSATEIICPPPRPVSRIFDEFSENASFIQKAKLESIKIEMDNDSSLKSYIVEKFKRGTSSEKIKQRVKNIYLYFYETFMIVGKHKRG